MRGPAEPRDFPGGDGAIRHSVPQVQGRRPVHVPVRFRDVTILQDAGTRLLCLIEDKRVWVPVTAMRLGTEVWTVGDHGTLVISHWWAVRAGLRFDWHPRRRQQRT